MNRNIKVISIICIFSTITSVLLFNNEQKDDIHIYYTGDVHCAVSKNIGYSSLSAYIKQKRNEYQYVTLVDTGDFLQDNTKSINKNNSISTLTKGYAMVQIMNEVGYDIVTIGNHEFDFDLPAVARDLGKLNADITVCNAIYKGDLIDPLTRAKDYIIEDYDGTKVAFVGVTSADVLYKGDKEIIKDKNGRSLLYFYENNAKWFYKRIQSVVNEAHKKADYVVLLSHLGTDDLDGFSSIDLIKHTYNIDVVLDSHSHDVIESEKYTNLFKKNVILTSTGKYLINIGELVLKKDKTIVTSLISSKNYSSRKMQVVKDAEVDNLIKKINDEVYGTSK